MADKTWAGTTYGNGFMHHWLVRILRWMDVRVLYLFAAVFIVPVCLLLNNSRSVIYNYFRQRQQYGMWRALWGTYVNHVLFSQVVIDRFSMYAGKHFHIQIDGLEHLQQLTHREQAFLQLSSHIGNYELAGYTLVSKEKTINALVFSGEKESIMKSRNEMFSDKNIKMIPVKEDMSHLYLIDQAIQRGEIVSMPADRVFGSPKTVEVKLLGAKASLPMGPFRVATMRNLEVLAINVMKVSWDTYKLYVTPLPYDANAPRSQQISELSTAYAAEIERMLKLYPAQWYNFFNFWES